jgi:hypothetical protein
MAKSLKRRGQTCDSAIIFTKVRNCAGVTPFFFMGHSYSHLPGKLEHQEHPTERKALFFQYFFRHGDCPV